MEMLSLHTDNRQNLENRAPDLWSPDHPLWRRDEATAVDEMTPEERDARRRRHRRRMRIAAVITWLVLSGLLAGMFIADYIHGEISFIHVVLVTMLAAGCLGIGVLIAYYGLLPAYRRTIWRSIYVDPEEPEHSWFDDWHPGLRRE